MVCVIQIYKIQKVELVYKSLYIKKARCERFKKDYWKDNCEQNNNLNIKLRSGRRIQIIDKKIENREAEKLRKS